MLGEELALLAAAEAMLGSESAMLGEELALLAAALTLFFPSRLTCAFAKSLLKSLLQVKHIISKGRRVNE